MISNYPTTPPEYTYACNWSLNKPSFDLRCIVEWCDPNSDPSYSSLNVCPLYNGSALFVPVLVRKVRVLTFQFLWSHSTQKNSLRDWIER